MVEEKVYGEYGKKKLLMYADSFQELAESFEELAAEGGSRQQKVRAHALQESMQALKDNLWEVSRILQNVAEETAVCIPLTERLKKKVVRLLSKEKLIIKDIY